MTVCASYAFRVDDLRYFDAVVDSVKRVEHLSANEECKCTFVLCWKHGPNVGYMSSHGIASICLIQPFFKIDDRVASFSKMSKGKIGSSLTFASPPCNENIISLAKKGSSSSGCSVQVKELDRLILSSYGKEEGRTSSHHDDNYQDTDFGCLSNTGREFSSSSAGETYKKCSSLSQWGLQVQEEERQFLSPPQRIEDSFFLQGKGLSCSGEPGSQFYILVDNLEKDLPSSSIVKFIQNQTFVSCQACIFPNLTSELYARGAIFIDSEKNLKMISKFLKDSDHIVVSSRGRPWFIIEETSRCKNLYTQIPGLMPIAQDETTFDDLKVLHKGDQGYGRAKLMRDLFLEFAEHLEGLHKSLALEEKIILQL